MSRNHVHVDANARRYLGLRDGDARYASFDYCFNYFQDFHEEGRLEEVDAPAQLQTSCLQLGFYLASWGMFRGRAELLNHSAKRLVPVVRAIAAAPRGRMDDRRGRLRDGSTTRPFRSRPTAPCGASWRTIDDNGDQDHAWRPRLRPAYDRFFRTGFGAATFGPKSLRNLEAYCRANADAIERHRVPTLDFATGASTQRRYTKAKVIDMVFFTAGLSRSIAIIGQTEDSA